GQKMGDVVEYVVQGSGRVGGQPEGAAVDATVLRTKAEDDTDLLKKLPGAQEGTKDGAKYYAIDEIPELGYPGLRVFAPTNRLVVFCRGDMPDAKFRDMLNGNKDNPDATAFKRGGPLAKQASRGTIWEFVIEGRKGLTPVISHKTPDDGGKKSDDPEAAFRK